MNRRQLNNEPVKQQSAVNQSQTKKLSRFDVIRNDILGHYREVFNAWNTGASRVFTYLKSNSKLLVGLVTKKAQEPLSLQLIPIKAEQRDHRLEKRKLDSNGNRSI